MKLEIQHPLLFSDNCIRVLERRYLKRDHTGKLVETPAELFQRVAKAIAKAELNWGSSEHAKKWEKEFFEAMYNLRFLPNSPTLMNAGMPTNQLSACFVLPLEDHLEDIFSSLKLSALIQQSGGGTGFNFSHLRPKGDLLHHTQGTASGPVSFMKIFDVATEQIKQGGKRRGANMGILNIDHPDIEEFIACKRTEGEIRNFNISVGVTDAFMKALNHDQMWDLVHPNSRQVVKRLKAKKLWSSIVNSAWLRGDPGLIFLDTVNTSNPTPRLGRIEATNPCGEVPLLPYESCNLGSINLSKFMSGNTGNKSRIDWQKLEKTVSIAIRFLDNVIDVNHYLLPEIKDIVLGNRKVGLGIMGWAEALSLMEIPYQSEAAIQLAEKIMKFVSDKSREASMTLAKERGTFKNWAKSIYYPDTPIRNATRTSIAPTGTIAIIADTSQSIEPFFALAFERKHVLQNETLQEINKTLISYLDVHKLNTNKIITAVTRTGTLKGIAEIPECVKTIFKTATEIAPSWHLRHQAAFQKFTDNAVSKTINLSQDSTRTDVDDIFQTAWQNKLKGITIYRNNSRKRQVMQQGVTREIRACKVCIE